MHPLRDHGGVGISHPQTRGAEVGDQKREQRLQTRCPFKRPPSGNRGHSWRWGGGTEFHPVLNHRCGTYTQLFS